MIGWRCSSTHDVLCCGLCFGDPLCAQQMSLTDAMSASSPAPHTHTRTHTHTHTTTHTHIQAADTHTIRHTLVHRHKGTHTGLYIDMKRKVNTQYTHVHTEDNVK